MKRIYSFRRSRYIFFKKNNDVNILKSDTFDLKNKIFTYSTYSPADNIFNLQALNAMAVVVFHCCPNEDICHFLAKLVN